MKLALALSVSSSAILSGNIGLGFSDGATDLETLVAALSGEARASILDFSDLTDDPGDTITSVTGELSKTWAGSATLRQENDLLYLQTNGTTDKMEWNLPARRNLLTYTEDFSNGVWVKTDSSVSVDQVSDPFDEMSADLLAINSSPGATATVSQQINVADATTYTTSVYLKYAGTQWVQLWLGSTGFNGGYCNFDVLNGVKGTADASLVGSTIESVGNGWYRCSITKATTAAGTTSGIAITPVTSDAADRFGEAQADGTVYLVGAQLEVGAAPTEYQPIASDHMDDMTVVMAIRTSDDFGMLINGQDTSHFNGIFNDANTSTTLNATGGTPSFRFNGSSASPSTRDDLHTLIATNEWQVVSLVGANWSAWTKAVLGYYAEASGANTAADYAFLAIFPTGSEVEYGPELVTNGNFTDGDTTGFTLVSGATTVVDGECTVSYDDTNGVLSQTLTVEIGAEYEITGTIVSATSPSPRIKFGSTVNGSEYGQQTSIGTFNTTVKATTTTLSVLIQAISSGQVVVDNISVRKVTPKSVALAESAAEAAIQKADPTYELAT